MQTLTNKITKKYYEMLNEKLPFWRKSGWQDDSGP